MIDAVGIIGARDQALTAETYAAIKAAQAAGTSQQAAMCANALELSRIRSILPGLPTGREMILRKLAGLPWLEQSLLSREQR